MQVIAKNECNRIYDTKRLCSEGETQTCYVLMIYNTHCNVNLIFAPQLYSRNLHTKKWNTLNDVKNYGKVLKKKKKKVQ